MNTNTASQNLSKDIVSEKDLNQKWVQKKRKHLRFLMTLFIGVGLAGAITWAVSPRYGKEIACMADSRYASFSPDGKYVVSGGGSWRKYILSVRDASTGVEIVRIHVKNIDYLTTVAYSPDGRFVASGTSDDVILVWDAMTGNKVAQMTEEYFYVDSIVFSPNSKYLAAIGTGNEVYVFEVASGKEIARMEHSINMLSIAFSPDSKYVVSGGDDTARVWDVFTGNEIARVEPGGFAYAVAFSPDGKYVASSHRKTVSVWEAATGKEITRMTFDKFVNAVAFSPDGNYIVVGGNTIQVLEAHTGKKVAQMVDALETSVAFSPNGKYIVSGGCDRTKINESFDAICASGSARVWEAFTGKEIARMTYPGKVTDASFSADGKYVLSVGGGIASVWEWNLEVPNIFPWPSACSRSKP